MLQTYLESRVGDGSAQFRDAEKMFMRLVLKYQRSQLEARRKVELIEEARRAEALAREQRALGEAERLRAVGFYLSIMLRILSFSSFDNSSVRATVGR